MIGCKDIVSIGFRDIEGLAMGLRFAADVRGVVSIKELGPASEALLHSHLRVAVDSVDTSGGNGFWIGYPDRAMADAAIDRWHDAGLIDRSDVLDIYERTAEGTFVCTDPDR